MNCIVVDDEPLAREAIQLLVEKTKDLHLLGSFNSANAASKFMADHAVDLIFLDIQMPGISGIEFAKTVPYETLVIFTTAFSEYALDSYEVEAIDYLVKPVQSERFQKAVSKAASYLQLLKTDHSGDHIETVANDYFFVKAERKIFRVALKDILFIASLKDYVILHTDEQRIITAMNIKTIHKQLPQSFFVRISKGYIINLREIDSFDNNTVFIRKHEIPIGNAYRNYFFDEFVAKKLFSR
ncbi:LytTR family DNA-binding domain-containing protein [Mucilaginibacter sp. OK283]|uniref:LytR/AlgR family response regulator transcription factor n=1 Tax=Mucilaginibacter sp. OK283 TaxID=1881049 RepID=UPI0008D534D6|nr:LytTR family DNA-binding domain-containing protein [Mucilaginibacter sp. OK283]SEP40386.1 two component transcriptional regulator, LytTR family [Mucilaginibacter sp. OK283]